MRSDISGHFLTLFFIVYTRTAVLPLTCQQSLFTTITGTEIIRVVRDRVQSSMSKKKEIIDHFSPLTIFHPPPLPLKGNSRNIDKINVSRGMNRGLDPPAPLCNEFPFFLDIDLCTRSLRQCLLFTRWGDGKT